MTFTNDLIIRSTLKKNLENNNNNDKVRIIEEFGVQNGNARIDIAVINGTLHGYEIKSDRDTLTRLPDQMALYNSVFDQITLVIGKSHLYEAINIIPDWWGIMIAKIDNNNSVILQSIRKAKDNKEKDSIAIAKLLWKSEAIEILDELGQAKGYRSKPRSSVYEKLSEALDQHSLEEKVRRILFFRQGWRSDVLLLPNDD